VAAGGQSLLEGTFELVGNNNLDRYLEELGVELLLRQLAVIANPRVTISRYLVVVRYSFKMQMSSLAPPLPVSVRMESTVYILYSVSEVDLRAVTSCPLELASSHEAVQLEIPCGKGESSKLKEPSHQV
jgi:hypothetical protein